MTTPTPDPDAQPASPRARFAAAPSTILASSEPAPAAAPAPATPAPPKPSRRPQRRKRSRPAVGIPRGPGAVVAVVTLAVAVAVVLAVVVTGLSNRTGDQVSSTTSAAVEKAATSGIQTALSYNYQHLASNFTAAEKLMTPGFAANFAKTTNTSVKPLATKYHAVSTATVEGAGVGSISSSHATVLVFVDQTVTNSRLSAPRLDRSRVEVSLERSGGRWVISNISPF